ncbi:MAG: toll/interleukin-1 receptor domain-containing protein [Flavobacteriales bacterium]|nr:toll/interleukin-1 receptor domain-containing protein [Flavobacteriales bacterium]
MDKQVFVSYGRKDAEAFTEALCERLMRENIPYCRDTEYLKDGYTWTEVIVQKIEESDILVAVLSHWAMRDKHSFCNKEIHHASKVGRTIIPVQLMEGCANLDIATSQTIQIQNWDVEKQLTDGIDRVIHVIRTGDYPESELTDVNYRLKPSDMSTELRGLIGSFVGREALINRIDDAVQNGRSRVVLIDGDPGVGKSALWAELIRQGKAAAYFRCMSGDEARARPEQFVRTVVYQLARNSSKFRKKIQPHDVPESFTDMVSILLAAPLNDLVQETPLVIAIDALDEGMDARGEFPLASKLQELVNCLPSFVRFIVTCRDVRTIRDLLPGHTRVHIDASEPENLLDVERYVLMRSKQPRFASAVKDPVAIRKTICTKAHGNFLYAKSMMDLIESDPDFNPADGSSYPADMKRMFLRHFKRAFPDPDRFGPVADMLSLICASLQPVGPEAIAAILDMEADDVKGRLRRLYPMLRLEGSGYVPFHRSLIDWLVPQAGEEHDYQASVTKGHRRIIAYCKDQLATGGEGAVYPLGRLPQHYLSLNDAQGLAAFLEDPRSLDHLDLSDLPGIRALWSFAFAPSGIPVKELLVERLPVLLHDNAEGTPISKQLARTVKVASLLARQGAHAQSRVLFESALQLLQRGATSAGVDAGTLQLDLAIELRNLEEFELSEKYFLQAEASIKSGHGEESALFALVNYRYATLLWQAGAQSAAKEEMWQRSLARYQQAASMLEKVGDPLWLPELYNDLSVLQSGLGWLAVKLASDAKESAQSQAAARSSALEWRNASVASCQRGLGLLEKLGVRDGTIPAELHYNLATHLLELYQLDFRKSIEVVDPLKEIHGHAVRSRELFTSAVGSDHEQVRSTERLVKSIEQLITIANSFFEHIGGRKEELAAMAMNADLREISMKCLLLPADLVQIHTDLYGSTKNPMFMLLLAELQCAILHYRRSDSASLISRFDPILAQWRETPAHAVTVNLLVIYFHMLQKLDAHEKARTILDEYVQLHYARGNGEPDDRPLMTLLGYLMQHDDRDQALDLIDQVQAGQRFSVFKDKPELMRLKASLLYMKGDFARAAAQQDLFLRHRFAKGGPEDATLIYQVDSLGLYQKSAGDFTSALDKYNQALRMAMERRPDDRLARAHILGNIASLHRDSGALEEAEREMNEVVALNREIFGGDHENCAMELVKRASILLLTGNHSQARNDIAQAMLTYEVRYAPETRDWNKARSLDLLRGYHRIMGDLEEGRMVFEQAREEYEGCRGSRRPVDRDRLEMFIDHGRMLHDHAHHDALGIFEQARDQLAALVGAEHYLCRMATCWSRLVSPDELDAHMQEDTLQHIARIEDSIGSGHPHAIELRLEFAARTHDPAAIESILESLRIGGAFMLGIASEKLGRAYRALGQVKNACAAYEKAAGHFTLVAAEHPLAQRCRRSLKDVMELKT